MIGDKSRPSLTYRMYSCGPVHHALRLYRQEPRQDRARLGGLLLRRERRAHLVPAQQSDRRGPCRTRDYTGSRANDLFRRRAHQVLRGGGVGLVRRNELALQGEPRPRDRMEAEVHDRGFAEEHPPGDRGVSEGEGLEYS